MPRRSHRAIAAVTAVAVLAGCTTRMERIGADDGMDACRAQLVALDSTGNFFAEDILKGAAIGAVSGALLGAAISGRWQGALIGAAAGAATGAAGGYLVALQQRSSDQAQLMASLAGDLARENAELDRTQIAFNQLMDCRFNRAQQVREAYRQGRLPKEVAEAQMADLRNRTQRDITLARTIDQRIGTRGSEFDTAIEAVAPGTKSTVIAQKSGAATVSARASRTVPVRLRPDPAAPVIGEVPARATVQARPAGGGFALVQGEGGQRSGYVEAAALSGARGGSLASAAAAPDPATQRAQTGDVRTLAASNIARRENFTDTVATAERAAAGGGFELAT
jgi:hypothetical protein